MTGGLHAARHLPRACLGPAPPPEGFRSVGAALAHAAGGLAPFAGALAHAPGAFLHAAGGLEQILMGHVVAAGALAGDHLRTIGGVAEAAGLLLHALGTALHALGAVRHADR